MKQQQLFDEETDVIEAVKNFQLGNEDHFKSILEMYSRVLNYFSKKYFAEGLSSCDLYQSGCIGLFKACKRFDLRRGGNFNSFAYIHIKNHIINTVRFANRKNQMHLNQAISIEYLPSFCTRSAVAPSAEDAFFERVINPVFLNHLRSNLSRLERAGIAGLVEGMSYREIAEHYGVEEKAINNAIQRARTKIRKEFALIQDY